MIADKLYEEAVKHQGVCVGLDTLEAYFPNYLIEQDAGIDEKLWKFNQKVIDATKDEVACYKVQIACYEAYGLKGLQAYSKTLKYIRDNGKIVIADVKRGDIFSTAKQYAKAHFTGDFEADYITVNTYMGEDAISPYYDYIKNQNKGLFALVKTSNPSGVDLQDVKTKDGKRVYQQMAQKVNEWGSSFRGKCGFSAIGAVVGLTYAEEFENIREDLSHTFLLIPGYGAQGGTGEDIAKIFKKGLCGVVNSSRAIISAHKGIDESENFAQCALDSVIKMKEDIGQWL